MLAFTHSQVGVKSHKSIQIYQYNNELFLILLGIYIFHVHILQMRKKRKKILSELKTCIPNLVWE
jgi:hypothetical protein